MFDFYVTICIEGIEKISRLGNTIWKINYFPKDSQSAGPPMLKNNIGGLRNKDFSDIPCGTAYF
ncbi:MAG: hypothetical protein ACTHM7_19505 [Ginsengibacter sp.]